MQKRATVPEYRENQPITDIYKRGGIHPGNQQREALFTSNCQKLPLVQKHLTKSSLIFSCLAFQQEAIG